MTEALAKQPTDCDPVSMMRLSKRTKQAVQLLVCLARQESQAVMSVPAVSQAAGVTGPNGFKLVPILVEGGFLKTEKGRGGGVLLAMQTDQIRVGDLVKFVETFGNEPVTGPVDPFLDVDAAFDAFIEVLNKNTIADMAANARTPDTRKGVVES